ncbi:MAG: rhamnogalacturonan acetylesterase [Ruminiclostridium sp.]|nr:rhamnogalacturonan acetylesterase [Ruminiclostridium sp.]
MGNVHVNVFIAGDSTVQNCASGYKPQEGWGRMLPKYFNENVHVHNYALGGRSAKSFIDEKLLSDILKQIEPEDTLLVQFGHNDEKLNGAFADPFGTYQAYLKRYIDGARERGAIPVLLSPVNRRCFNLLHEFYPTHGAYPQAVQELCSELNVPFIDLTRLSAQHYIQLGEEESKKLFLFLKPGESENYPDGSEDNTHFIDSGAYEIAGLVVKGMREIGLPLIKHLKS